ncbi:hypothetical protein PR048_008688 [Dryococelus australis]|uniref:Uncharacterized protein n=1 Tax=Dryococelus australis TaxID=614101 RepID=A0ABQ9HYN3_9NEOP|nr:hypothetical protein PR048_008688 [Dryococelus australis]
MSVQKAETSDYFWKIFLEKQLVSFYMDCLLSELVARASSTRKLFSCSVVPSWFETRSELVSKIDTENCCAILVQNWTGDRDEVHFETLKLAVRNLDPRSTAIVDKCKPIEKFVAYKILISHFGTKIDDWKFQNHEISLMQHFYIGKIKLDPGSELGSFDIGSGKMLDRERGYWARNPKKALTEGNISGKTADAYRGKLRSLYVMTDILIYATGSGYSEVAETTETVRFRTWVPIQNIVYSVPSTNPRSFVLSTRTLDGRPRRYSLILRCLLQTLVGVWAVCEAVRFFLCWRKRMQVVPGGCASNTVTFGVIATPAADSCSELASKQRYPRYQLAAGKCELFRYHNTNLTSLDIVYFILYATINNRKCE